MGEFISHCSWMRDIPDDTLVTALSIPGTHDSCSIDGFLGFGKTQNLDLTDQLSAGIRFIDIRLAHYRDNLFVHHDVVHMGKCYADILAICSEFLKQHPSETILMSIKDEGRFDSNLGRFAPSEVFGKFRGSRANWVVRSDSFQHAFQARTWQYVDDESLFYNLAVPRPAGDSATTNSVLTSQTTLEEVRGKIILLRRFEGDQEVGCDLTYWPENRRFRSRKPTNPTYDIEDRYRDPGEEEKCKFVIDHLEKAMHGDLRDLYITFSSAVNLKAIRYSKMINPRLDDYLLKSPRGRVGIIVMDHFEQPRELVSNVISMNPTTGATAGHNGGHGSSGRCTAG